jgi:AraC-like DNA-binding protein
MVTFQVPLDRRPRLRMIGIGVHGKYPIERYHLHGLWCIHLYRYHARLSVDGQELEIQPGDLGVLPADARLIYWFKGPSEHLFAHFELPRRGSTWAMPALRKTGHLFSQFHRLFEEAVGMYPTHPLRAEVRLWDLLWSNVLDQKPDSAGMIHPGVAEVIRQIELRLHEPLSVASLARGCGLSQNHLTRLFQSVTGRTVKRHIIERRMEKALHLLRKSSNPIKNIAGAVGFEDLHAFNKAVRKYFGSSPRALR